MKWDIKFSYPSWLPKEMVAFVIRMGDDHGCIEVTEAVIPLINRHAQWVEELTGNELDRCQFNDTYMMGYVMQDEIDFRERFVEAFKSLVGGIVTWEG